MSRRARKTIPDKVETKILTKSRRRCCICFGLSGDNEQKNGQIVHLDRDPANYSEDNLAWLCLDHHAEYDTRGRQAKGYTISEVKRYRDQFYLALSLRQPSAGLVSSWPSELRTRTNGDALWQKMKQILNPFTVESNLKSLEGRLTEVADSDAARSDILIVDGLIYLAKNIRGLSINKRHELLREAIRWTLDESATWNVRVRSLILVAVIASTDTPSERFDWRYQDPVRRILSRKQEPKLCDHWLASEAMMFGDEQLSCDLAKAAENYVRSAAPDKREHATLNICEGLRTALVVAERRSGLQSDVPTRAEHCLRWVDLSYYSQLRRKQPENEFRLLLIFANLLQCQRILKKIRQRSKAVNIISKHLKNVRSFLKSEVMIQSAETLIKATKSRIGAWPIEAACLHEPRFWQGDKWARLRDALISLFQATLEREKDSGPGWESWRQIFRTYGMSTGNDEIVELANKVRRRGIAALSQ